MTPTTMIVPTLGQMLTALSGWIDKAQAQMPGERAETLLGERLAPDMFPLATQLRFACVQAYEAVHRLRGEDFPAIVTELLDEGRAAGDHPGTIAEARARIAETIAMLDALPPDALDQDEDRPIAHALPMGAIFDLSAAKYARDWVLPQFYFHLMTAYAILRAAGVELGKGDYIAHLFPHLRPGTLPAPPQTS